MRNKKHVLVTGGAGFIGSHMVDRLIKDGYEVSVFDNFSTGYKENIPTGVSVIKGDTSNVKDVQKAFEKPIDIVFHIAGCASTITSFSNPLGDIQANFLGTVNVVNACIEKQIPRLLFASSMTVYGYVEKIPTSENAPTKPISYYGISKYAAERFIHATGLRRDLKTKFNVTSFRMFNVYGPRQSLTNPYQGVMAIFIGNVLRNEPITIFGDGKQSRDFIFINDVVDAWVNSIKNENTYNNVYNLGYGKDYSLLELTSTIIKTLKKDPKKYPIKFKETRPGDQRHMRANITNIKKILNWKPKYNLKNGLQETISWAQQ